MAQPYVGEIRMFAGNFAPVGWMFCEGQQLPISENETLFQLIGTTYGGDGESTFNLPDLRGRIPLHQGQGPGLANYVLAEVGGVEEVTLTINQIPAHSHPLTATNDTATQTNPGGQVPARFSQANIDPYLESTPPNVNLAATAITPVGGSQPHTNFQPYLCVNFIISLFGIFPSQT
jgi:microcystin-dependent protein